MIQKTYVTQASLMTFSSMLKNSRDSAASSSAQNYSTVSEFILIGFSHFPQQLLPTFFLLYLLILEPS
ncbi:hypothetical protein R6Z07F_006447 [Ovis aries]